MVAVLGDRQRPTGDGAAAGPIPPDLEGIGLEGEGGSGQARASSAGPEKGKTTPLEVVVDSSRGLFILHPNILVSGSRVSGFPC